MVPLLIESKKYHIITFHMLCLPFCLQEYEINETGLSTFSLYSDYDDDDRDDDCDYDQSDEDEDEEDNTGGSDCDDDNPFAPAEMYLSDLLDINGGGGRAHVYVPDNIMFHSPKLDPLYGCSLKSRLEEIFSCNQAPDGFLMRSVNSLDEDSQLALRSLLQ